MSSAKQTGVGCLVLLLGFFAWLIYRSIETAAPAATKPALPPPSVAVTTQAPAPAPVPASVPSIRPPAEQPTDWNKRRAELIAKHAGEFVTPPRGALSSLKLLDGTRVNGTVEEVGASDITLKTGPVIVHFPRNQISPASRVHFFAEDYAVQNIDREIAAEKAAQAAGLERMREEEQARQKAATPRFVLDDRTRASREIDAAVESQAHVRGFLKYPDDADFGFWTVPEVKSNPRGDAFYVSSKVKAKNAFGAALTYRWQTIIFYNGISWQLALCAIDGKTLYESKELLQIIETNK